MVGSLNDGVGCEGAEISESTQSAEITTDTENKGSFDDAQRLARLQAVESERVRGVLVMAAILDETRWPDHSARRACGRAALVARCCEQPAQRSRLPSAARPRAGATGGVARAMVDSRRVEGFVAA